MRIVQSRFLKDASVVNASEHCLVQFGRHKEALKRVCKCTTLRFRNACQSRPASHLPCSQRYQKNARTCIEGPFGELLRATGPMAAANLFRFSTKYQDEETGLMYYGYRYYAPGTGRWLGRDPIEERGEFNLFAFLSNSTPNFIDPTGLEVYPGGVPPPVSMYPPGSPMPAFWGLARQLAWHWFNGRGTMWTAGGEVLKEDPNIKNAVAAILKQVFAQECQKALKANASKMGTSLQFIDVGLDSLPLRATLNHPNPYLSVKVDYDATMYGDDCCCYNTLRIEAHWYDIADMDHWHDILFWSSEHFLGYGRSYPIDIVWKSTATIEKCLGGQKGSTHSLVRFLG